MAKTRDIKRRIRSIRNTMQLTRAMKMVAAAKLRRSQERMFRARPYAAQIRDVLRSLAARANPDAHPLLRVREMRRAEVLVIAADKGLCGSFNHHICKTGLELLHSLKDREVVLQTIGKKAREFYVRRGYTPWQERTDVFRDLDYPRAAAIARELMDRYTSEGVDAVFVVYNEFKSAIQQKPVAERLLPLERMEPKPGEISEDYIYEPDAQALFDHLLPRHVEFEVYHALLESVAAEHAARMTAMESATNNASDLIDSLTLHMNRVRQASITTEIIEVVSGARALG